MINMLLFLSWRPPLTTLLRLLLSPYLNNVAVTCGNQLPLGKDHLVHSKPRPLHMLHRKGRGPADDMWACTSAGGTHCYWRCLLGQCAPQVVHPDVSTVIRKTPQAAPWGWGWGMCHCCCGWVWSGWAPTGRVCGPHPRQVFRFGPVQR